MAPIHGLAEASKHLNAIKASVAKSSPNARTPPPIPNLPLHLSQKPPQYFQLLQYYRILYRIAEQYPTKREQRHNKHFLRKLYSRKGAVIGRKAWNEEVRKAKELEAKWRRELMERKAETV